MGKFLLMLLVLFIETCSFSGKKPEPVAKDSPVKWIDDNTLHIRTFGLVPMPKKDSTTNKLMACQKAREKAIEIFNLQFTKPKDESPEYTGRIYNSDFHRYTMKITTFSKKNDEKGNCRMTMQFQGENLKTRLNAR